MIRLTIAAAVLALPAAAATLELPRGSTRAREDFQALASYSIPASPWSARGFETIDAEGRLLREAWHVPGGATTLQLLAPLREQLTDQGYSVVFECATTGCGGFDFRFETEVLPEPAMHVDLGDFRFLTARREGADPSAPEYVTLLISRSSGTGYVQFVKLAPPSTEAAAVTDLITKSPTGVLAVDNLVAIPTALPGNPAASSLAEKLDLTGRVILADLTFPTGSTDLDAAPFASLEMLADYLVAHPDRRITLVGHTDTAGSLEANIDLSRARARSVMNRLVNVFGIPAAQLQADGVGYLMPLASNLTDDGRATNRRVEAVLTIDQ